MSDIELPGLPVTHYNGFGDGSCPLWTQEHMEDFARAAVEADRKKHPHCMMCEPNRQKGWLTDCDIEEDD